MSSTDTKYANVRLPVVCLALVLQGVSAGANAVGLGGLDTGSNLNQPFNALIPLRGSAVESARWDCKPALQRLAGLPYLPQPKVAFLNAAGAAPSLKITTATRVREPVLGFRVELNCGARGSVIREYSVLLDPPALLRPAVPQSVSRSQVQPPHSGPADLPGPVIVQAGESLSMLAQRYYAVDKHTLLDIMGALYTANAAVFMDADPNRLPVGARLRLVPEEQVQAGAGQGLPMSAGQAAAARPEAADGGNRIQILATDPPPEDLQLALSWDLDVSRLGQGDRASRPTADAVAPETSGAAAKVVDTTTMALENDLFEANAKISSLNRTVADLQARLLAMETQQKATRPVVQPTVVDTGEPVLERSGRRSANWLIWLLPAASILVLLAGWFLWRRRGGGVSEEYAHGGYQARQSSPANLNESQDVGVGSWRPGPPPEPELVDQGTVKFLHPEVDKWIDPDEPATDWPLDQDEKEQEQEEQEQEDIYLPQVAEAGTSLVTSHDTVVIDPADQQKLSSVGPADRVNNEGAEEIVLMDPLPDASDDEFELDFGEHVWNSGDSLESELANMEIQLPEYAGASAELKLDKLPDVRNKSVPGLLLEVELHLLYEQYDEAINILGAMIANDKPDMPDVRPWTALFDLYKSLDQHAEFDALVNRFRGRYNIKVPSWVALEHQSQREGLEQKYPWVLKRIIALWTSPDCVALLNSLLLDDRRGERQGFDVEAAEEISFLRDLWLEKSVV